MKNILEELWYGNIIPMEHSADGNAYTKKPMDNTDKHQAFQSAD